ncbi:MAG: pilin [Gammaproteobacteria bacterium]
MNAFRTTSPISKRSPASASITLHAPPSSRPNSSPLPHKHTGTKFPRDTGASSRRGFSLLEILIVLSIISILAVIAIPSYLEYQIRAEVSEGFSVVSPIKTSVVEYFETYGTWPNSNAAASLRPPTSYKTTHIDSIGVAGDASGASITITYNIPALGANNTIVFTPSSVTTRKIEWSCKQGSVINKYRPVNCRI